MGRTYRTMQGRVIDMDKLRSQNELTPAVGNMKVNARGDEIGRGGKIMRTREQVMSTYYETNPNATPDADAPKVQPTAKTGPVNPPSQPLRVEDTPVSAVIKDVEPEKTAEPIAEEKVLDKGVEAVQKARARRKGIADATGDN